MIDRDLFDWYLAQCLASPVGSADRLHYSRMAVKVSPTAGIRQFAREQHRVAARAFSREVRRRRPITKDLLVIAISLPPGMAIGLGLHALIGVLLR